ncbi:MAG TPA: arginine deiminase [Acidimicrobiia bacterium]|nr:arginine deiminase [Acidimicrobiia bacterium]
MPAVFSEIGPLRTVLVHRPGVELARLTPQNKELLLYDDILWVQRAQEEHDRMSGLMRDRGVEVLYVRDLLEEVFADEDVRRRVVDQVVTPATAGAWISEQLRAALRECEMERALDVVFGGIIAAEMPDWGIDPAFSDVGSDPSLTVIRPLPNMMFTRDNAAWVGRGLVLGAPSRPIRRPEPFILSTIYSHHPRFRGDDFPVWFGGGPFDAYPATIEGGDVLVLDERTVLVGSGERTSHAAIELLANRLFDADAVDRVIVASFPHDRSFMHLDTVLTMVDHDALNLFPPVIDAVRTYVVTPIGGDRVAVDERSGLVETIEEVLDRKMRIIATGGDDIGQLREQWNDGNNTLALEPGVVLAYARNTETNQRLRDEGIEVLELDASELVRGRGGSRCLTQPIERAGL